MAGAAEERDRVGHLHDLAGIHDGHPVAHLGDDAQIMGHQDDAHTQLLLELVEQLHDLVLDGYVQRRGGLIRYQ